MSRVVTIAVDAATALHIVAGRGLPGHGAHTRLAVKVADVARELGFRKVGLRSSSCRQSTSRYVHATDRHDRVWEIRIANHHRPERTSIPHLDLISADGEAGLDDAREFLRRISTGDVAWFDSPATASPAPEKIRKRIHRCK